MPKLHCDIDMGEDGYFRVFLGLDMIRAYNELRGAGQYMIRYSINKRPNNSETGKGFVTEPRNQWAVIVHGHITDYKEKGAEITCGCMLAPLFSKGGSEQKFWCNDQCRVKINSRQYHDCTRREVLEYFIDFEAMHTVPKDVLEYNPGGRIKEYEYKRSANRSIVPY